MPCTREMERGNRAELSRFIPLGYARSIREAPTGRGSSQSRARRRAGATCSAAPNRLPAPSPDAPLALAERAHRVRHADERADDLQRPPASLLGAVRRELRPSLAVVPRPADPRLGNHPLDLQSGRGAALAPGLRLAARGAARAVPDRPASSTGMRSAISLRRRDEVQPRHVWHDIREHARLRFPTGDAALRYNILQKLSYVAVIFVASAADDPDRPCHVAGDGRGLAVAARPLRRPAVGALDPLHLRDAASSPSSSSIW